MALLLDLFLPVSLAIIMFSLGLGLVVADFVRIARIPRAFLAGATAQMLLLPLVAFALLAVFPLGPELALGVMILSFCPGGVTSNMLVKFAGGAVALSITLTAFASLASVLTAPILVEWMGAYFLGLGALALDLTELALAVFLMTTLPVTLGMLVRAFLPGVALAVEGPLSAMAALFFVIIVLLGVVGGWDLLLENLVTLGPLLVTLNVIMLGIGLTIARLTGLEARDGLAIAMEAGVQNAALGITLGGLVAAGAGVLPSFTLPSAVYGITMYVVIAPFILWARLRSRLPAL